MTSEQWEKISGIFKVALELNAEERPQFLARICGNDRELQNEVEKLLASYGTAGEFEKNAFEVISEREIQQIIGKKIGFYEVIRLVGMGGMGEVYLAKDSRLGRHVALKLLAPQFTNQFDQVERFQLEAKATSSLNHPNILTVHDFGEFYNRPFFVTEFVQGETLRFHLVRQNLTLEKKLDIAIQIARGIAAAHEAGIVHRDIKPENIMLREDGYIKILDFGLAKLTQNFDADKFQTISGMILGTVNYMSPEQASGLEFDQRTDIWSLGIVIFEMLSGKAPFDDETPSAVLASILKSETPSVEPAAFNRIVRKALQKNKDLRYQSVKELLADLMILRSTDFRADSTEMTEDTSNLPTVATNSFSFTPNNLTIPPTVFVGRKTEIENVKELLNDENIRFVTLTGAGGTGKTRLALQVATELLEFFLDGIYFVRLATITNPELVASVIAQTLDVKEAGNLSLVERLKENLRDKKTLLLLDNFEHLLSATPLITELLSSCPRLKILLTSRAVLRVRGEHEFFVPTMSLPETTVSIEKLKNFSAVKLFVQSARAVKSDFKLTPENAAAIADICRKLDGLPLALELAAARIKLFTPQVLAKKLSLKMLSGGAKDLPEKQQTMRDAIAWSYEFLSDAEKKTFRSLAVFAGGFTFESAEIVCDADNVFDEISSLVDKSLLQQREQPNGDSRLFMLMTIKEFGLDELVSNSAEKAVRSSHLHYFQHLAEEHSAKLRGKNAAVSVDILEEEHSNLRLALDFALENDLERASLLTVSLSRFWILRNYYVEGLTYFEKILSLYGNENTVIRAEILNSSGTILRMQGKYNEAHRFYNTSLEIGRTIEDPEIISFSLDGLAIAELFKKNYTQSQKYLEESLRMAKLTDDEQKTVNPLNLLGEVARIQGNHETALIFYREAYKVLQKTEINPTTAVVLNNLGYVNDELGRYDESLKFQKECLNVCLQLKNRRVVATSIDGLASLSAKLYDFERAAKLLGAGFSLRKTLGFTKTPTDMPLLERAVTLTKSALGEEKYQKLFEAGQVLTFDEAIEFAVS
jgi:predicted ATPase/serine/threonine protein kinase